MIPEYVKHLIKCEGGNEYDDSIRGLGLYVTNGGGGLGIA